MRGQLTVEFTVIALLVVLIFSTSVFVFGERNNAFNAGRKLMDARQFSASLARAVNDVYLAGEGARTQVFLPQPFDYNVSVGGRYLEVSFDNKSVYAALLTSNVRVNSFTAGGYVSVRRLDQNMVIG